MDEKSLKERLIKFIISKNLTSEEYATLIDCIKAIDSLMVELRNKNQIR